MVNKKLPQVQQPQAKVDDWLVRYVNKLKNMMNLSNWKIVVDPEPCSEDALAETTVTEWQHFAKMQFHKNYKKDKPEDLRATVIHELLHCYFCPVEEVAVELVKSLEETESNKSLAKSMEAAVRYQSERAIDLISEAIAPFFPCPDIPKIPEPKKQVAKKSLPKKRAVSRKP